MIFCFSGKIGSGKSSISKALADELNYKYVSFSNYLKNKASDLNVDSGKRSVLQRLGADAIDNGIISFCLNVLNQIDWETNSNIVIDGIRHIDVLKQFEEIFSKNSVALIFIETDELTRIERLEVDIDSLKKIEEHSTESQVDLLRKYSKLVLVGTKDFKENIHLVRNHFSI